MARRHRRRALPWLAEAETKATSWIIAHQLPEYLAEVQPRRVGEVERTRERVKQRLTQEINRLAAESLAAEQRELAGERPRESADSLSRKADDLSARLDRRLALLDRQAQMSTKPPRLVMSALVLPLALLDAEIPTDAPIHAVETKEVERRGVERVLAAERALGRVPHEQPFTNPGFDVLSDDPDGEPVRIEVKARLEGATDFFVTHNEVITAKNAAPRYRLALVRVDPRGAEHDEVRYVADPFRTLELGDFAATGVRGDWAKTWAIGRPPF